MEDLPTHVQVGAYTYCIIRHSKMLNPADSFTNQANQTISLAATLTPQREAAALIRAVCQIIFEMMGNESDEANALSREFGTIFAATLGASPEGFAWCMAGLLEDREDRQPKGFKAKVQEVPDQFIGPDPDFDPRKPPVVSEEERAEKALAVLGLDMAQAINKGYARVSVGDGVILTEAGKQAFLEAEENRDDRLADV
jgi:hypothetical protein